MLKLNSLGNPVNGLGNYQMCIQNFPIVHTSLVRGVSLVFWGLGFFGDIFTKRKGSILLNQNNNKKVKMRISPRTGNPSCGEGD